MSTNTHKEEILRLTNASELSNGGFSGRCLSHDDKTNSLTITFEDGKVNPLLHCHAGCSQEEVIREFKERGLWANEIYEKAEKSKEYALKLWESGKELTGECLGSKYLKNRGLSKLSPYPKSIRFHEKMPYTDSRGNKHILPCLIFKIIDKEQRFLGIQRVYLNNDGTKFSGKYAEDVSKKILGSGNKGFIVFGETIDSKNRHHAEGPETALAIFQVTGEMTCSMVNANNLVNAPTSKTSKTLHFWADLDQSRTGEIQSRKAAHFLASSGQQCVLHLPNRKLRSDQKGIDYLDILNSPNGKEEILEELSKGQAIIDFPMKLEEAVSVLPIVSPNYLPTILWEWAQFHAQRLQLHPEELITPYFFAIGSVLSPRTRIKIKKHDKWEITPNLWGVTIAPPGSKKSAAIDLSFGHLLKIEREAQKEAQKELEDNQFELKSYEERLSKLRKDFGKKCSNEQRILIQQEVKELNEKLNQLAPRPYRLAMQTATIEKVADVISKGTDSLAFIYDELSSLILNFTKNGHENDRPFYLKGWNGDSSHLYDTKSGGQILIELLCLSVYGGIQPSILKIILDQTRFGASNDGFLQRFQLAIYSNPIRNKKFTDIHVPEDLEEKLKEIILEIFNERKLFAKNNHERSAHRTIELNDRAYEKSCDYQTYLLSLLDEYHDDEIFSSHLAKYPKLFGSLVLIFHALLCKLQGMPIGDYADVEAVNYAIKWTNLYYEHAKKIYGIGTTAHPTAFILAEKIKKGQIKTEMTAFDISIKGWQGLKSRKSIESGLETLQEYNWLKMKEKNPSKQGGRPTKIIELHARLSDFLETLESGDECHE